MQYNIHYRDKKKLETDNKRCRKIFVSLQYIILLLKKL